MKDLSPYHRFLSLSVQPTKIAPLRFMTGFVWAALFTALLGGLALIILAVLGGCIPWDPVWIFPTIVPLIPM